MAIIVYLDFRHVSQLSSKVDIKKRASHTKILKEGEELTIGRSVDASIYLPNEFISPQHCVIANKQEKLELKDQQSSLGIYYKKQKISSLIATEDKLYEITFSNLTMQIYYQKEKCDGSFVVNKTKLNPKLLENYSLGSYKILPGYTTGTSSYLFQGQHIVTKRKVAIKLLKFSAPTESKLAMRLQRVARLASKLSHAGLPILYHSDINICEIDGKLFNLCFLIFEYIDGMPLKDLVKQEEKLTLSKTCNLILQTAHILDYIHKQRIVHRNLSATNIMVDKEGKVKVLGINFLKDLDEKEQQNLTGSLRIGIMGYAALEQMDGSAKVDHRADIFSLGAIFYYCLCGTLPYQEHTKARLVLKEYLKGPIPPHEREESVPKGISAIIVKCLNNDPNNRYQSMQEFIDAVEEELVEKDTMRENFYSTMPLQFVENDFLQMNVFYKPLEKIGGDFYSYQKINESQMLLFLGDFTGHGASAGVLVGMAIAAIRCISERVHNPQKILMELHRILSPLLAACSAAEVLCTLIDFKQRKLTISQAGGIPVILLNSAKAEANIYQQGGTPVALIRNSFQCQQVEVTYEPGDILVSTTDGIPEAGAFEDDDYGLDKITELMIKNKDNSCMTITKAIYNDAASTRQIHDDITLLAIKFK